MLQIQSDALRRFDWEQLLTVATHDRVARAKELSQRFPPGWEWEPSERAAEDPVVSSLEQDGEIADATIEFGEKDGRVSFRFAFTTDGWRIAETAPIDEPWRES